jgi:hypothetical protein
VADRNRGVGPADEQDFPEADLNEAALRRTHSRVAEPTVEVM